MSTSGARAESRLDPADLPTWIGDSEKQDEHGSTLLVAVQHRMDQTEDKARVAVYESLVISLMIVCVKLMTQVFT